MLYFIVNPKSGTGRGLKIWKEAKNYLQDNHIEYRAMATRYDGHATELAKELSSCMCKKINLIVIGGDGTVNEVLNGITDFDKINFAVIPTGSGNDFARGLGIKCEPLEQLVNIIMSDKTETIDIGKVTWNDKFRYFSISAGVGLDAIVCKKALTSSLKKVLNRFHMGKLTYIILTIQTLFSMTTVDFKVSIDGEERRLSRVIFAAAMNFRAEGGGVPMAPSADARDGLLSMCLVHTIPKWRTFFCLPLLCMAKHEKIKGFDIVNCRKCEIEISEPVVLHADGEYVEDVDKVTFECVPKKLNLII